MAVSAPATRAVLFSNTDWEYPPPDDTGNVAVSEREAVVRERERHLLRSWAKAVKMVKKEEKLQEAKATTLRRVWLARSGARDVYKRRGGGGGNVYYGV